MDQQQHTPPTLAEVQGTLDELAAAARAGEADRYRAALRVAKAQDLTEEQISDAYRWGRRHEGAACLLYTSPSPRDRTRSRMPSSA